MKRMRSALALSTLVFGLAACSDDIQGPVDLDPALTVIPGSGAITVTVCKTSFLDVNGLPDDGTLGRSFDFEIAASSGGTILNANPTLVARPWLEVGTLQPPPGCEVVWQRDATSFDDETVITVSEVLPDDAILESVSVWFDNHEPLSQGVITPYERGGAPSITLVPLSGARLFFKNSTTDGGGGGQGCTPGYWRQAHHYDSWVGLSPDDSFADVFGVGPEMSLGQAVRARGGGANALIRHAVAALLNANSPDVEYDLASSDIIDLVQSAFASGEFEDIKDLFDDLNNQGCELN